MRCHPMATRCSSRRLLPSLFSTSSVTSPLSPISAPPTPSVAISRTNRSSSVSDEPPSPRKTSIGRGGGDGSHKDYTGSVLYPSYSYKKVGLWSDWFLRFHSDQAEHSSAFGPPGPGLCAAWWSDHDTVAGQRRAVGAGGATAE